MRDELQALLKSRLEQGLHNSDRAGKTSGVSCVEIENLYELLQSQNLAAVDKCNELASRLIACLGESEFERLRTSIDQLEFLPAVQAG